MNNIEKTDKQTIYYTDSKIVGNLANKYIETKNYKKIKMLCSSIKHISRLRDDYVKLVTFLEKNNQLSDYLINFHENDEYNFINFRREFKELNNIQINDDDFVRLYEPNELTEIKDNDENFRFFVKVVGNTKELAHTLDVRKLNIMWIANTPVWFVPYENLRKVLNLARTEHLDITVEKNI